MVKRVVTACACGASLPNATLRPKYHRRSCDDCQRANYRTARARRRGLSSRRRYEMIQARGPVCPACGAAWDHDSHRPELDHIVPLSRGGTNDDANLRVICGRCNRSKGAKLAAPEVPR